MGKEGHEQFSRSKIEFQKSLASNETMHKSMRAKEKEILIHFRIEGQTLTTIKRHFQKDGVNFRLWTRLGYFRFTTGTEGLQYRFTFSEMSLTLL